MLPELLEFLKEDIGDGDITTDATVPEDSSPSVDDGEEELVCGATGGCGGCRTSTATQAANSVWMILALLWMFVRRRRA